MALISTFKAFGIKSIPWINNATTNTLVIGVARFIPLRYGFSIEIVYKPVVSNNVTTHFQWWLADIGLSL